MKIKFNFTIIAIIFGGFCFSSITYANNFTITALPSEINYGEQIYVQVKLTNKEKLPVTAINMSIEFNSNILSVDKILTGQSDFKVWLDGPKISQNSIELSGLAPGGNSNEEINVIEIIFNSTGEGRTSISTNTKQILFGEGQNFNAYDYTYHFTIRNNESLNPAPRNQIFINDSIPPKTFTPIILRNLSYKNSAHLAFTTIDTETGISHFEILFSPIKYSKETLKENQTLLWEKITSPYLVPENKKNQNIYLKALDNNNNSRIIIIEPIDTAGKRPQVTIYILIFAFITLPILYLIFKKWGLTKNNNKKNDIIQKSE